MGPDPHIVKIAGELLKEGQLKNMTLKSEKTHPISPLQSLGVCGQWS